MGGQADAQDELYVRGLLTEAGVEESPELVAALLALRSQAHTAAPEPAGKLGGLLAGTPVPLVRKSKRTRGIILSAALVGAMAAGAGGVAANPDFLIRADPRPSVTFTPEDVPTVEKAPLESETDAAAEVPAPAALPEPSEAGEPSAQPVPADEPAADREAPDAGAPESVPAPAVVPKPVPAPAPGRPGTPGTGSGTGTGSGSGAGSGPGKGVGPGPQTGHIPGHNRRADGGLRDTMGPGVTNTKNRAVVPEKSRMQDHGRSGPGHPGQGGPGGDR